MLDNNDLRPRIKVKGTHSYVLEYQHHWNMTLNDFLMETKVTRRQMVRHMTGVLLHMVQLAPGKQSRFYVMENVTIFILGMSQKPDVTMSAFPFMSSRSQSV